MCFVLVQILAPLFLNHEVPQSVLAEWKTVLGSTLRGPKYYEMMQKLDGELALIDEVEAAMVYYANARNGLYLSLGFVLLLLCLVEFMASPAFEHRRLRVVVVRLVVGGAVPQPD